ncbi:MAG TPA: glycosyltransferase family 2 protein, partial [Candidatus Methylomirabilis sp.]|nr:glycosyltransferase family 2 protein [Candidatus Methylomirabilis sp.]
AAESETPLGEDDQPALSVIVPVYNDEEGLRQCLGALLASRPAGAEIIVVDDASTDASAAVAARLPVRLVRLPTNSGPAAARNTGARCARGDMLLFVDSDVVLAPGALARAATLLRRRPDVAAVFGSYDASPAAAGIVSRYKNLLHHFVHQNGAAQASTFWAGCGAIRRSVFEEVGGFDHERFRRPSIEDIELGYRLRRAGHRILLDKALQGKHLKRWTLRSLLRTDVMSRAIPWSRLIVESGQPVDDLNVRRDQRLSAALVGLALVCLLLAPLRPGLIAVAVAALLAVAALNRRLYAFFARQGGLAFAGACLLLHWLYYLYSTLAYVGVWASVRLGRAWARAAGTRRTC